MQIIGFNFTKISASREKLLNKPAVNASVDFVNIEKEKMDMIKDKETLKLDFKFEISYKNEGKKEKDSNDAQILFEGNILILSSDEEAKDIFKLWKKKELPPKFRVFFFNLIFKKCSARALSLQDELNLPSHINIPQISLQKKE